MSTARLHAEWLNLIDISGPFLTVDVLLREFPQGPDLPEGGLRKDARSAYEEWRESQQNNTPDAPAVHRRWIGYVLDSLLQHIPDVTLATGQAIPPDLMLSQREFGIVRPDYLIHEPDEPAKAQMLIKAYPFEQSLERQIQGSGVAASPATQMMELLHATNVRLGLVTNGEAWMLVHAVPGETTSFVTWYADLWFKERLTLQAFYSLLCVQRFNLNADNRLEALMTESASAQHEVTDQLGKQVREAVEILIQAIDRIDRGRNRELLVDVDEKRLYEAALTVMMRLVFLMTAEERELLLLGDPIYDQHYAVTTLRAQLREVADQYGEEILERRFDAWSRLLATFRAVHSGVHHADLLLPAYGGSLFDPDRFPFLEGRTEGTHWRTSNAVPLTIDNRTTLHLLEALQILRVKVPGGGMAETRRLSFRALSVTQIGHVYEGLLDHEARRADDTILGFSGTSKTGDPEIALSQLEALWKAPRPEGEGFGVRADVEAFLKDVTGSSPSAVRNRLDNDPDPERVRRLRLVCGDNADLFDRVLPYLNFTRDDDRGKPYLVFPGGVYVTAGATRRSTGTHYTPESLTVPVVKHTLEPLVYMGPAEGWHEADWQLKSPAELLDLKVCDMAMGSGAFLVQVVEYLSDRLLEAWEQVAQAEGTDISEVIPRVLPHGERSAGQASETVITADDRKTLAKRLVADRCIYGVDKNPLAVEMAKLSLWLITLSKGRAFTFLDHALKAGDSLVGVSLEQLRYWKLQPERNRDGEITETEQMIGTRLQPIIAYAIANRRELAAFTVNGVTDQREKARLHAEAEAATAYLKRAGDHLIAEVMGVRDGSILSDVIATFKAVADEPDGIAALQRHPLPPPDGLDFTPFHWELEYPEVFERGGFDAFVGNPPFIGGKQMSGTLGAETMQIVKSLFEKSKGAADYVAYFFRQSVNLSRVTGYTGLIATKTIAETDTQEVGLRYLLDNGVNIYRATKAQRWPGEAGVFVSIVHMTQVQYKGQIVLDDAVVHQVSANLDDLPDIKPFRLKSMKGRYSEGIKSNGNGFIIDREESQFLLNKDDRNIEVLQPYLNSSIYNEIWDLGNPQEFAINFGLLELEHAQRYVEPFKIVEQRVRPQREEMTGQIHEHRFWLHWDKRENFFSRFETLGFFLIAPITTKYITFARYPSNWFFSHMVKVFAFSDFQEFAVLQSTFHDIWVRRESSNLGTTLRYSTSDAFDTFAFPVDTSRLNRIGETYHETRRQIMLARQEGLTATYNRFHNPDESAADIAELRALHVEMDTAVALAYGWGDLALGHDFHETAQGVRFTISEQARREVLTRLLRLNHQRYAEECHAGLHKPKDCAQFFKEHPDYQRAGKSGQIRAAEGKIQAGDHPEQETLFDDDDSPQKRLF